MSPNDGVRFREVDGRRSSIDTARDVFAHAAAAVDPALAEQIHAESNWRTRYLGPVRRLVEAGTRTDRAPVEIARAGLGRLHERIELSRGGDAGPLSASLAGPGSTAFETMVVRGAASGGRPELAIPYQGRTLRGDDIRRQLDAWVENGIIEPSARERVEKVLANPDWLDLTDRRFVVLGAASQMGALEALCAWGADVTAIDLPVPHLWERILRVAHQGSGRVSIPSRDEGDPAAAGADLLTDTPEIAAWLGRVEPPYTVIDDTYADGATFVLVAATTDALMSHLSGKGGVSLAYLATPTDVFAVPEDVALAARETRRRWRGVALRGLSGGNLYRPSYAEILEGEDGRRWGIVDCLVAQQGANYALAKTLQRWRATVARANGIPVSANVAPATRTRSVTKNKALSAAYRGASAYGLQIFEPETSRWLMAALLVHDLRNDGDGGATQSGHPYDLFVEGAAHGGIWRLGYEPRSILPLAVARGIVRRRR